MFTYTESKPEYVQYQKFVPEIKDWANLGRPVEFYPKEDIGVVNSTIYANNLYNSLENSQMFYNGNITLINNTNETKIIEVI